jgi:hypothetical protein
VVGESTGDHYLEVDVVIEQSPNSHALGSRLGTAMAPHQSTTAFSIR